MGLHEDLCPNGDEKAEGRRRIRIRNKNKLLYEFIKTDRIPPHWFPTTHHQGHGISSSNISGRIMSRKSKTWKVKMSSRLKDMHIAWLFAKFQVSNIMLRSEF